LSWAPGPVADSKFTREEMAKITAQPGRDMSKAIGQFAPGWQVAQCGSEMDPGLRAEWAGRKNVLATHPLDRDTPCVLSRTLAVPAGRRTTLGIVVGHDPQGDFDLIVRADGKELLRKTVGPKTAAGHWLETSVDLTPFAGRNVKVEVLNQPTGWAYEAAYWASLTVTMH
jgi:hypothetical protein